jgi:tryptophan-rich sensory protein
MGEWRANMFIDTQIDAVAFLLVTFMVGEFLLGHNLALYYDSDAYHAWHRAYRKLIWLPKRQLMPLVWVLLAVAVEASLYTFLKHLYPTLPSDSYVMPTVLVLLVINLWLQRFWTRSLVLMRNPGVALVTAGLLLGTGVGIMVVLGLQAKFVELGCLSPYVLWCALALWFSLQVLRADRYQLTVQQQLQQQQQQQPQYQVMEEVQAEPQLYEMSELNTAAAMQQY